MIVGIGTDIIEIERIKTMLDRHGDRLPQRLLTEAEFQRYTEAPQKVSWLAKRFAAKEAAAKALGTGIAEGVSWKHIEVTNDALGAPLLVLHEVALQRAQALGANTFHVSLSDERTFAVAYVILEGRSGQRSRA